MPATFSRPCWRAPPGAGSSGPGHAAIAAIALYGRGLVALTRGGVHSVVALGRGGARGVARLARARPPLTGPAINDPAAARLLIAKSGRGVAGASGRGGGGVGAAQV
ncbi:hypothetical protein, partial [Microbispora rosea]